MDDVKSAVLDLLSESCADCVIEEQKFYCDPEYLTYRARLEGTSETDSNSLISLIEAWVITQPNITAGGLLTVSKECVVLVSGPKDRLCGSSTTAAPDDESFFTRRNIIIIAGAGGGALLILLCLLVICYCVYCYWRKNSSKQ